MSLTKSRLASSLPELDQLLEGGLPWGHLCEWGMPFGQGGRELIVRFLAQATQAQKWCLWVQARSNWQLFPPALRARGVDLKRLRLARTDQPLRDLKPALLDSFFNLIVFDGPIHFKVEEFAFMARQARSHNKLVLILRDYTLTPEQGNVWAKIRLNSYQDPRTQHIHVQGIRGVTPRRMSLPWRLLH